MKPESKKVSEKRQIQIKDDSDSTFDLSLLKEAIDSASDKSLLVPKTQKYSFDLTSMSHALSSVNCQCNKQRHKRIIRIRLKSTDWRGNMRVITPTAERGPMTISQSLRALDM